MTQQGRAGPAVAECKPGGRIHSVRHSDECRTTHLISGTASRVPPFQAESTALPLATNKFKRGMRDWAGPGLLMGDLHYALHSWQFPSNPSSWNTSRGPVFSHAGKRRLARTTSRTGLGGERRNTATA